MNTLGSSSISAGAQYVTLDNKIKCLNLAVFFTNPTNKTGTGMAYTWGLLIANHLDQSLQLTNLSRSQVQFITLVFGAAQLCCAFYQLWQAARFGAEKPISWAKPAHFDFYAINFTVWSHTLSTIGDALKNVCTKTDSWGPGNTSYSFQFLYLCNNKILYANSAIEDRRESPIGWNCKHLNWIWQSFLAIWKKCALSRQH